MRTEPRTTEADAASTDLAGTPGERCTAQRVRRGPQSLRGFWRRDEGAFTMMFAVLGGVLIGTMCLGIDSIRFTMSQTQMQMALDVAALSSGADLAHYSDTNGNNYTQWQADALAYYQGNMPSSYLGMTRQPITATVTGDRASGQTINLSTSAKQPLLAPFFLDPTVSKNAASGTNGGGVGDPRTFATVSAANSVIRLPQTLLELSLVLDNTGSMSQSADGTSNGSSKLQGLKDASNTLLSALYSQSNSSNTTYVGLVPFASTVNLTGALSGGGSWMNPVFSYNSANVGMTKTKNVAGWGGCAVEPRDAGNNLQALAYSPSDALKFTPYYYNVPPAGLNVVTFAYGFCYNTKYDTSQTLNNVPLTLSTNGAQNWCKSPQGTGIGTEFDQMSSGTQTVTQNSQCMGQPVTFMTNQQNTLTTAVSNMVAGGSTIIPEGLLWGWRMLSPAWSQNTAGAANGWISTDPSLPKPLTTQGLQRVMIVLTDGENQIGAAGSFPNTLWFNGLSGVGTNSLKATSIGLPNGQTDSAELHGGNPVDASSGNNAGYPDDVNTFQNAVCNAIKADGVTVYAITFGSDASNSVAQTAMRNCASPGNYYHAPDNASLNTIFQQIAGNLGELRLTK
ncbi:TadE/TadG family type IV pilus assembly protein [Burkholderia sp. 3C]